MHDGFATEAEGESCAAILIATPGVRAGHARAGARGLFTRLPVSLITPDRARPRRP